jgi:cell division protein ZapE
VGIGKTFILNLFLQSIAESIKYHFNHLMINLHAYINNAENKKTALDKYIKDISKKYRIVFLDELHIFNIVDALLIKKVFLLFKKYKIFVLVSSNFHPSQLYKDGLQRNDFIPFIKLIEEDFRILHLNQTQDYRRQMLNQSKTYFTPINQETRMEFNKLFERFVDSGQIHIRKIQTKSRAIRFEKCTTNIAYCTFKELCQKNLAHEDYSNIAKAFSLIFIDSVPQFTYSESDQCRRFISLIDMLYDQQHSVVILAQFPINQLCKINQLSKEFERTASRLYEMTIINQKK